MTELKKNPYGIAGVMLGCLALLVCILSLVYGLEEGFRFEWRQIYTELGKILRICGGVLGGLALIASIIAYIRKEYNRLYLCGAGLGVIAIAWEFVAIAIGLAIMFALFFAFVS